MKININEQDILKLNNLKNIFDNNYKLLRYLHNYLFYYDKSIDGKMINSLKEYNLDEEYSYYLLLCGILDLDIENKENKIFLDNYLLKSIKKLELNEYLNNPYYQNIKFDNIKKDNWELRKEKYLPYQGFVYDDFIVLKDYHEVVSLGFFNQEFEYLAVLEDNVEWMTITPNEINTMKEPICNAKGKVVTFGLGLGYFPYMASLKDEVESITIVEKDDKVISLFKKYILPQFKYKEKIKIIKMDAFEYIRNIKDCDYLFIDLWRDVSDGLNLYLKFKKYEDKLNIKIDYWIEKSIICYLRRELFNNIINFMNNEENYLDKFNYELDSYDDIVSFLSDNNIKQMSKKELD